MRGFRDIAADADDLGRAAAQANRNARKTYANVPSPSPEFDRLEPNMENRGADPEAPYAWDDHIEDTDRSMPPAAPHMPQPPTRSRIGSASEREPKRARSGRSVSVQERDRHRRGADPGRRRHPVGQVGRHHGHRPVQIAAGGRRGAKGHRQRRPPRGRKFRSRRPAVVVDNVAPVAQRVVLYDEDPSDPKGKQYVGSVIWRTEPVKGTGNQKPDVAVRADIDIPTASSR
jgi:hypothetical protein